ncbi:GMC oxidoreductase [Xylariomycetidae sp. FL0641]|nr:GMC oxidoreductase [Xylariomycetidae sp. FL0641]
MSSETYDFVIVGGGTAGLVLASRLSEDPDLQVLVVESGQDRSADPTTLTPGAWPLLTNSPNDWMFSAVAQEGLDRQIKIPQGKALGGSSAINSFLFTSTSKASVEAWKDLGNEGWDYAAFDKALRKSFTLHGPAGVTEGDGPLQVTLASPESEWEKAWIDGLESVGFPKTDPLSGQLGGPNIAPESINPKTKQRSYAGNAYLNPARNRPNLTIRTETTVTKVLLEKPSPDADAVATGVQVKTHGGGLETLGARKEVIISCGAINSPRLLELSGIGGAALLRRLGIEAVVDNAGVGEGLQNHLYTGLVFEARDDADAPATLDAYFRGEPAAVRAARDAYAARGAGPMSTSNMVTMAQLPLPDFHGAAGRADLERLLGGGGGGAPEPDEAGSFAAAHRAFVRGVLTDDDPAQPVGNYVFGPAWAPFAAPPEARPAAGSFVSVAIELSHPLSRGSVHVTDGDGVVVDCRYLSHPLDLEVLARQLRFAEDVVTRARPLARRLKPYTRRFGDLETAREYVRRHADGAYHYTGTCAMMPRDLGGVVDARLRVYGCRNLRVCDASILPIEPTAQPQAVVYAVAEMGSGFIKEALV